MKYTKLLLLFAGVIWLAFAEDLGYLNLSAPSEAIRPGQQVSFTLYTTLPLEYAYLELGSGESYLLEKSEDSWQKTFTLPANSLEGYLPYSWQLVLPENFKELEQIRRDIPQSNWQYKAERKILNIRRRLYVTRQNDIQISAEPANPVPGQKILVTVQTPFAPETAVLTYAGRTQKMILSNTIFSTEISAVNSGEIKIILQNQGQNIERSIFLTLSEPETNGLPVSISNFSANTSAEQANTGTEIQGIQVKGNKTIVFVNRTAEGETDYPKEQHREETLYIETGGRENSVNIAARIFTTTQETADKKEDIMVRLWTDRWSAYMGDFTESIEHSVLGLANKNLNGFRFSYFPKDTELTAIIGQELGADQEEYFYGNDSQGPYSIVYPPAVPGSEQVFLDGRLLLRDRDYYFDHRGGRIIFRQNVIAKHQLIRVLYQSEITPYKNQFLHALAAQRFGNWLWRLNATNAKDINTEAVSANVPPLDRRQYTAQLMYTDSKVTINLEKAVSEKDTLENTRIVSRNRGEAEALSLEYDNKTFLHLAVQGKHSDEKYQAIGNPTVPGLQEENHFLEFYQPNYLLRADLYRKDQRIEELGETEKENYYKLFIKEDFWPELQYWHKNTKREILSISSTANAINQYTGNNLELAKSLNKNFRLGLSGSLEEIENNLAELPLENVETYGAYIQTQQLSNADFIIGKKYSQKKLQDLAQQTSLNVEREETYTRLNIYPNNKIRFGTAYQKILDKSTGDSELMELDYALSPWDIFNSNGNYSIETLIEEFASTNQHIQKQRGNFLLRYQPFHQLRTTLRYAPNVSLADGRIPYALTEGQNAIVDLAPFNWSALKYTYTANRSQSKDITRLADNILNSENQNQENMYLLRILPLEVLDLEFKYRDKNILDNFLDENITSNLIYSEGQGFVQEKGLNIYYRPWKHIQLINGYSITNEEMHYLNLPSFNAEIEQEIYNTNIQYQIGEYWTVFAGCDFLKTTDFLVSKNNITYEYAPGAGFSCRYTAFRLHYDYKKIESVLGEKNLKHQHNLSLEYYWSSYLQSSLTLEKIKSELPAYEIMDLLGKISASF